MSKIILSLALFLAGMILSSPAAYAQSTDIFSMWAIKNEGSRCIRPIDSYGQAQIMNICSEPVSIAYCNSTNCDNFQNTATLAPQSYFTFSSRGASIRACKPRLTAALGREKRLAMCLPSKITVSRYLDKQNCFSQAIGPDRKTYVVNHCSRPIWFAYCVGIDGECKRFDTVFLSEPGKLFAVSTLPELPHLAACESGGKPQLTKDSLVGKPVTCLDYR